MAEPKEALRRSKRKAKPRFPLSSWPPSPPLKKHPKPPPVNASTDCTSSDRTNAPCSAAVVAKALGKAKAKSKTKAKRKGSASSTSTSSSSRSRAAWSSSSSCCLDLQQVRMGAREKERLVDHRLTLDVMQLRQEIQHYQMLKSLLLNKSSMHQQARSASLIRFVKCYYNTFRYGFWTPFAARKQLIRKTCEFDQTTFLLSIMEPTVRWGRFAGIEVILDQWQRYANFFHYLSLSLVSIELIDVDGLPIIKTQGDIFLRFTRKSVIEMFPHVLSNERLVQKLIGLHVKFRIGVDFFLNEHGRVVRFEAITHYFDAISHAFDDLNELCEVMSKAKISEEGCLGHVLTYPRVQETNQVNKTQDKTEQEMSLDYILS